MNIDFIIIVLLGLSSFFLFISLFMKNSLAKDLDEVRDNAFDQTQEIYRLRERINALETFTGFSMTQPLSFTAELRNLNSLTKENIIKLYEEGRSPEDISIFANIPIETVQILIDRHIQDAVK